MLRSKWWTRGEKRVLTLHLRAFQKWCDEVRCTCTHHSSCGTLNRWTLPPSSHHVATGDHQLYQTMKSWFWRCLTHRNNSFSTQLIPNRGSRDAFSLLFTACLVFRLPCLRKICRLRTIVYTSQQEPHLLDGTSRHICEMFFFSCLPLMILPPGIGDFCIFLCFPRAISSIHLGNNVVSVTLSVLQSLSRQHLRLQTSQRSPRYTCACHWFVQLKYPHSAILPFRNWGCVHYAGKYGNFVHRGTMLASFWGFLKGQFKYSNN